MTTHRDYTDAELRRAIRSAEGRGDAYGAAILPTLREEQRRRLRQRRTAARSALGMASGERA